MPTQPQPDPIVTLPVRVAGIPACLAITDYDPGWRGTYWEPPEPATVEWELQDRRGRPAPWLQAKLTHRDIAHLDRQAFQAIDRALREQLET